jgi:hypothetical protein
MLADLACCSHLVLLLLAAAAAADVRRIVAMDLQASVAGLPGVKPLMPLGGGIMMRCGAAVADVLIKRLVWFFADGYAGGGGGGQVGNVLNTKAPWWVLSFNLPLPSVKTSAKFCLAAAPLHPGELLEASPVWHVEGWWLKDPVVADCHAEQGVGFTMHDVPKIQQRHRARGLLSLLCGTPLLPLTSSTASPAYSGVHNTRKGVHEPRLASQYVVTNPLPKYRYTSRSTVQVFSQVRHSAGHEWPWAGHLDGHGDVPARVICCQPIPNAQQVDVRHSGAAVPLQVSTLPMHNAQCTCIAIWHCAFGQCSSQPAATTQQRAARQMLCPVGCVLVCRLHCAAG